MPKCPECGSGIDEIYTSKNTKLAWNGEKWVLAVEDDENLFICPVCGEELNPQDLDKLGVPNELR